VEGRRTKLPTDLDRQELERLAEPRRARRLRVDPHAESAKRLNIAKDVFPGADTCTGWSTAALASTRLLNIAWHAWPGRAGPSEQALQRFALLTQGAPALG